MNNMRMKTEEEATKIRGSIVAFNDVSGFWDNPRHENCWIYNGRMPIAKCWIFVKNDYVEIHNVMVYNPENRNSGFGSAMVADIRRAFPNHCIWVDSWNCTRGFWSKMVDRGKINFIANDYSWPCINTTCKTCHPNRIVRRRAFS
ncbi:MAG: hypothetical protein CXT69_03725 [Methanobacteriota archaeon]|jgi:hypothetical protein|nr:MAG: hypothetical protein CXT69_03725 [Euryarchaeota archaeon]